MESGGITERGTHDKLMTTGAKYIEMMRIFDKTTMKATSEHSTLFFVYFVLYFVFFVEVLLKSEEF